MIKFVKAASFLNLIILNMKIDDIQVSSLRVNVFNWVYRPFNLPQINVQSLDAVTYFS